MKLVYLAAFFASFTLNAASVFQLQSTKSFVVQIQCASGNGTGVIVSGDKVLTAAHVVVEKDCLVLDYKNRDYTIDREKDLAIIKLDKKTKSKGVRFANKSLEEYAKVWTIGFPLNLPYYLSEGRYIGKYSTNFDILNMPIIFGNSGGGLFTIEDNEIKLCAIISAVKQLPLSPTIIMPLVNMSVVTNYYNTKQFLRDNK